MKKKRTVPHCSHAEHRYCCCCIRFEGPTPVPQAGSLGKGNRCEIKKKTAWPLDAVRLLSCVLREVSYNAR